jgi:Dyp-type peroxidase family
MSGLRTDRIQGSVYPGFNKDEQAFLWLRFPAADSARAWLGETVSELTSAEAVVAFRALRAQREMRPDLADLRSTWVNVAFSRAGLELLAPTPPGTFPEPFEQGMAARAGVLGDTPATWRFGGTADTEAHALVTIGADTEADLSRALDVHRKRLARHGARDLFLEILGGDCRGAKLPGELRGHEHFGYRDGISEPRLDGLPGTGDFVLGYPDTAGQESRSGPAWTRDGSYLVFRRLHQDVAGFHRALGALAQSAGLKNHAQLGAKLFGRWPSGAKLADPIQESDRPTPAPAEYTAAEFAADPSGDRVPRFAHVRKANPRDVSAGGQRPGLLRRGIPYGPPLTGSEPGGLPQDDGRDRGLLFAAYQADLGRQYELVQRWLNDRNLPVPQTGQDPIAGQGEEPARLVLRSSNTLAAMFDMHHYVAMTGGGYFFTPSLSAAQFLANPTTTWEQQEAIMGDLNQQQLGKMIADETPYGQQADFDLSQVVRSGVGKEFNAATPFKKRELRTGNTPEEAAEKALYWQGFFWTVGSGANQTETIRISKAVRIKYKVAGVEYGLVVGFEGAGGM